MSPYFLTLTLTGIIWSNVELLLWEFHIICFLISSHLFLFDTAWIICKIHLFSCFYEMHINCFHIFWHFSYSIWLHISWYVFYVLLSCNTFLHGKAILYNLYDLANAKTNHFFDTQHWAVHHRWCFLYKNPNSAKEMHMNLWQLYLNGTTFITKIDCFFLELYFTLYFFALIFYWTVYYIRQVLTIFLLMLGGFKPALKAYSDFSLVKVI